jgi:hypothetical protein
MDNALGQITRDTIDMMKSTLGAPLDPDLLRGGLTKGVSISTGLTWYNLEIPAKNIYPTITPLRNSIPRVGPRGAGMQHPGDAAHWKVINSLTGSGYDSMGWVPEGQRSGTMSYTSTPMAKSYVTLGEEDFLTFEAEAAAEGFEDENAMVTFRLLQKMMRKEEIGILGGNASLALGTPPTAPNTAAVADTTSTLPTSATGYSVIVVPLTLEGFKNSSLVNGVATSRTITGADGKTFTLNGGSGNKSPAATSPAITVAVNHLAAWIAPIPGAVAYAWYVGTAAGLETLQLITGSANMVLSVPLVAGRQNATAVTADSSRNTALAYDGLLSYGFNPANLAYVHSQAQSTVDGTPAQLTTTSRGSVAEIDAMLISMWNTYNLGPSVLYVNAQEQESISNKVLNAASGPLLRYDSNATPGGPYAITAGGVIDYYYNPFSHEAGYKLPVKIHPDLPPGTMLAWCERLPPWYQSNEVPNVAEMKIRRDYYRVDWPLRTRQREYGVYTEEVLAIYAPFAMGIITNVPPAT